MHTTQNISPHGEWAARVLSAVRADGAVCRVSWSGAHTNDIVQLHFDHGRTLLVKRARHEWGRDCFATSAAAARLVADASDIVVPQPLPVEDELAGEPLQAYWRVELPTLKALWPHLSARRRAAAIRSLGALLRRLHRITPPSFGPVGARGIGSAKLETALRHDLQHRLLPAVYAHWTPGAWLIERLIDHLPAIARRTGTTPPALVHGDVHIDNVLCTTADDDVRCVGLLDLDGAVGSRAENDIACFEVLHGPLFGQRLAPRCHRLLRAAYGSADDTLIAFFRCVHLANQGFTSGLLGHTEHAGLVERALRRHVAHLERALCDDASAAHGEGATLSVHVRHEAVLA